MKYILLFLFTLIPVLGQAQTSWPEALVLTPERSNFQKTSTYAEVMSFLQTIKTLSPDVEIQSMGKSPEGKDIPLAILSKDKFFTPLQARQSGKMVIYIQGNIHAGEVEGKEVLMMLMREILLGNKKYLLDNQIILFAPIYNTDSNDKMQSGIRPSQEDSPLEVGQRENSQGLDLNRDGIKAEANETKALMETINQWDPQVFVDIHTTNGTWHAYSLTWAPNYAYAGEVTTSQYTNTVMLPSITKTIQEKYGLRLGPYGDYDLREGWPVKNFYSYNHHPRYLVNQFSLRNRMAILSEAFAHERFYQRIHSTHAFITEILEYTNLHASEITAINKKAEQNTIQKVNTSAGKVKMGVRYKMISNETIKDFITYDYISTVQPDSSVKWYRTGRIISIDSVRYFGSYEPVVESTLPRGYVIPAAQKHIIEHLRLLGITVQQLKHSRLFTGEVFEVTEYKTATRKFEGHAMATVTGTFKPMTKTFKKGDYYVDLAQPLGNLVFYVLEPQSDDGLITWNFFDTYFLNQSNKSMVYPVFKYY